MLDTHPSFGDLPACDECERRAWVTLFVAEDEHRRVGVFRCAPCGQLGTVHDAVETNITEFGDGFDT